MYSYCFNNSPIYDNDRQYDGLCIHIPLITGHYTIMTGNMMAYVYIYCFENRTLYYNDRKYDGLCIHIALITGYYTIMTDNMMAYVFILL